MSGPSSKPTQHTIPSPRSVALTALPITRSFSRVRQAGTRQTAPNTAWTYLIW
jgi:hypothetical protein